MAVHSKEINPTVTTGDFVANEIPVGAIDSHNTQFTVAHTPVLGTVQVILNGSVQSPGSGKDYTISGKVITFVKAPKVNSEVLVNYLRTT